MIPVIMPVARSIVFSAVNGGGNPGPPVDYLQAENGDDLQAEDGNYLEPDV